MRKFAEARNDLATVPPPPQVDPLQPAKETETPVTSPFSGASAFSNQEKTEGTSHGRIDLPNSQVGLGAHTPRPQPDSKSDFFQSDSSTSPPMNAAVGAAEGSALTEEQRRPVGVSQFQSMFVAPEGAPMSAASGSASGVQNPAAGSAVGVSGG